MLLCVCLYIAAQMALGRFVALDEVFFKAAGREWAATGRFAAPEIDGIPFLDRPGFLFFDPPLREIWFPQPPLYTFLFGVFARVAGFGPWQCILYDTLIHASLAQLTYLLARSFANAIPDGLALLVGVAVLPLGTIARPDELAMCFGMAGLILLVRHPGSWSGIALSGTLFGLSAGTMIGAAVLLGMIAAVWMALGESSIGRVSAAWLLWGLSALAMLAAVLAPILIACPDAYKQYTTHVGDQVGRGRYIESFLFMWQFGRSYLILTVCCLMIAPMSFAMAREQATLRDWLKLWLGPLLGLLFLAIGLPRKYFYLWFLGPWLLMAAVMGLYQLSTQRRPALLRVVIMVLVAGYGLAAGPFLKNTFAMLTLPASQSLAPNAQCIQELIPAGSLVMTDDYWWTLGDRCRVRDIFFSHPRPEEIDFIILTGTPAGDPGLVREVPSYLREYVREHFVPVHNNINPQPVSILGMRLPGTAFGFGVLVLQRASGRRLEEGT